MSDIINTEEENNAAVPALSVVFLAAVILAAVIGVHDETWQERPLLIVQTVTNSNVTGQQIRDFMTGKVAKWWLPDHVEFVSEIPLTAAGKINKKALREWYRNRLA